MKKSTILGSLALTLTLSLGIALPSYATNNFQIEESTPTREAILQMVARAKSLDGYYEYRNLINAVTLRSSYSLENSLQKINPSLVTSSQSTDELIKTATSLKDYSFFVYLTGLVDYTEDWLQTSYSNASNASRVEAYEALEDAIVAARLTVNDPLYKATQNNSQASQATLKNSSVKSSSSTSAKITRNSASTSASVTTQKATTKPLLNSGSSSSQIPAAKATENTKADSKETTTAETGAATISVTVTKADSDKTAPETTTNSESKQTKAEGTTKMSPVATGLTATAATFGLAGAALVTKREVTRRAGKH